MSLNHAFYYPVFKECRKNGFDADLFFKMQNVPAFPANGSEFSDPLNEPSPSRLKLHWSYSPIWPAPALKIASLTFDACSDGDKYYQFSEYTAFRWKVFPVFFNPSFPAILTVYSSPYLVYICMGSINEILLRTAFRTIVPVVSEPVSFLIPLKITG
jgi:hypothetical protein